MDGPPNDALDHLEVALQRCLRLISAGLGNRFEDEVDVVLGELLEGDSSQVAYSRRQAVVELLQVLTLVGEVWAYQAEEREGIPPLDSLRSIEEALLEELEKKRRR